MRIVTTCALGLATMLLVGPATASAQYGRDSTRMDTKQDTTTGRATGRRAGVTSQDRIPVRKDADVSRRDEFTESGAVATDTAQTDTSVMQQDTSMMRTDTSMVSRDTMMTADTMMTVDTMMTADTMTTTVPETRGMRRALFGNGFFLALHGGAAEPAGDFRNAYRTGYNLGASLGFHPFNSVLGVRIDGTYERINGRLLGSGASTFEVPDATILSGLAEVVMKFQLSQSVYRPAFYLIGGGGVHHFRNYAGMNPTGPGVTNDRNTDLGVNGGAGLSMGVGMADIFLESRYVRVFMDNDQRANYVPIVLGISFF